MGCKCCKSSASKDSASKESKAKDAPKRVVSDTEDDGGSNGGIAAAGLYDDAREGRTLDDYEKQVYGGVEHKEKDLLLKRVGPTREVSCIDSSQLIGVLELLAPTPEQMRFFQAWCQYIYGQVFDECLPQTRVVFIATDLSYMEVRATAGTERLLSLIEKFMDRHEIPKRSFMEIKKVLGEVKATNLTTWCKIKHICGGSLHKPSVDAGVMIEAMLDWTIADMLMPPVDDQDALRDYAQKQQHDPVMYGASILPLEPEKQLAFEVTTEETHVSSKQLFVAAFLFFKSMGFTKPEDKVERLLASVASGRFLISVLMGPKGLTRVVMSVVEPKEQVAPDLADALQSRYRSEVLNQVEARLGGEADVLDYVADYRGYSVSLGFVA